MLVLTSQQNKKQPIWIEITHMGETIRITACKYNYVKGIKKANNSVALCIDGDKDKWVVRRTSDKFVVDAVKND